MLKLKKLLIALAVVATLTAFVPTEVKADGPLRRWWRNVTGRTSCFAAKPQPVQTTANYNPYNLQPGQCMKTCQQTCSRTVVNYVPQTAYRTVYNRVPVTSYRPETKSDPCTGCTVTCMKPCTTYTYQVQRVPYTTYRPVYRQETYKVPVTTITNDCATGNCSTGTCAPVANNSCSTCGPGVASPASNFSPGVGTPTPAMAPAPVTNYSYEQPGALSTGGNFRTGTQAPTAADQAPSLNLNGLNPQSSQRPTYNQFNPSAGSQNFKASSPSPVYQQLRQPSVIQYDSGRTASKRMSPIRKDFGYSPIRMASSRQTVQYASQPSTRSTSTSQSRWVEE